MENSYINKVWFPDFELLELFYKGKLTHFHSLPHILRVWTIAMFLAEKRVENIDINVLSAAALLHDVGRETDFRESNHGEKSSNWIEDFLPVIAPEFSRNQIDFIKILSVLHCRNDENISTLELKILKDADALDRHRLPRGHINKELLRLDESLQLIEKTKAFERRWRSNSKKYKSAKYIWIKSAEEAGFLKYLPQSVRDEENSKNYTDRATYSKRIKSCENFIRIAQNKCYQLNKLNRESTLTINALDDLSDFLKSVRSTINEKDSLSTATRTFIYEYIWESLFEIRFSKGHSKEVEIRKNVFLKDVSERIDNKEIIEDKSTQYLFLQLQARQHFPNVRKALLEYYSRESMIKDLYVTAMILTKRYQKYLINIFSKISSLSDRISIETSLYLQDNSYKWTNLRLIQLWIDAFDQQSPTLNGNLKILFEYLLGELNKLISNAPLDIRYINSAFSQYVRILRIADKHGIRSNLHSLDSLLQSKINTNVGICRMGKCGIEQKINLFYLYTPFITESQFKEYFEHINELILFLSKRALIDGVFKNYLIPLSLRDEWHYQIDEKIVKAVKNESVINMYHDLNKILTKYRGTKASYEYVKSKSRENLESFLNPSEYLSYIAKDTDYKVTSNFVSFYLLNKIIKNRSDLLSFWNISNLSKRALFSKIGLINNTYFNRTEHRDSLQRYMLQRAPNFTKDHVYYGTLQNISKILNDKDLLEQIPTPTEIFANQRYGQVLLVFKDKIKERTVFTLFDTIWENRTRPVIYEDAKYLFEKITRKPIESNFESNPLTFLTTYIEADILGGVSLDDVEMIIAPKRLKTKNKAILRRIKKSYPNIQFR